MRRLVLVIVVALACAGTASAYPWPLKPFDRQHPIRGFFGDPRTVYENGILAGAFDGPSSISFHQGVDIAAPNGTPVYPVEDGIVHYVGAATINLITDHEVTFQYFHITPVAGEGERAIAKETVLGYVQPPYGHVHITEIDGSHAVNPLQQGHLTPYRDRTIPRVRGIVVRNLAGDAQAAVGLCGRVELDVDAYDPQPVPVPGAYRGLPVAPALVQWWMTRVGGKTVVPRTTTADFRRRLRETVGFSRSTRRGRTRTAHGSAHSSTPGCRAATSSSSPGASTRRSCRTGPTSSPFASRTSAATTPRAPDGSRSSTRRAAPALSRGPGQPDSPSSFPYARR